MNIVLDRHGKTDPVTRGLEILVRYVGLQVDVPFWSQHVSFLMVGVIVVTNIRGLLLQLMKVQAICANRRQGVCLMQSDAWSPCMVCPSHGCSSSARRPVRCRPTASCSYSPKSWACTFCRQCC